jgi:hypothetical protein
MIKGASRGMTIIVSFHFGNQQLVLTQNLLGRCKNLHPPRPKMFQDLTTPSSFTSARFENKDFFGDLAKYAEL